MAFRRRGDDGPLSSKNTNIVRVGSLWQNPRSSSSRRRRRRRRSSGGGSGGGSSSSSSSSGAVYRVAKMYIKNVI